MKKGIMLLLLIFTTSLFAQPTQYFKDSDIGGFPSLVKQLATYESMKSHFDYFKFDESAYNSLFYKSYTSDNSNNAHFGRMDITMSKKLVVEPTLFPNYKIVLNPKLEPGYVSKQPLLISVREESVSAVFTTNQIAWIFPDNILKTKSGEPAQALVNTTAVEYHNDGNLNRHHGIIVKGAKEFTLEPSFIPNSMIEQLDFKKAEIKFLAEEAYEFPFLVFENTQLANFMSNFKKANPNANLKSPDKYKSSVLFKNVAAKVNFTKSLNCQIDELYFFENVVSGVIDFPLTRKKELLTEIAGIHKSVNRGTPKLKPNGDFPTVIDFYNQTYFKLEQDSKSIKMYFIIVK